MGSIYEVELARAVLTASLAVIGGLIVLVIGQLIEKYYIEPLHEQSRIIGEISFALLYFEGMYLSPEPNQEGSLEASNYLRSLGAKLISTTYTIKIYTLFSFLHFIQTKENVNLAAQKLIKLSRSFSDGGSSENKILRDEIVNLLGIDALF